ncbi:MAG: aminotransferase class III-fold pyridoxal phosphate-dependent enzyme, partial [Steroidobacteraceae bacterium]
ALKVLVEEDMIGNAERQGARFRSQLVSIQSPVVREVRGRGLMLAVELHAKPGGARHYCEKLRDAGLLAKDTHEHTIRIAPPLIITRDEVDWACEIIAQALKD